MLIAAGNEDVDGNRQDDQILTGRGVAYPVMGGMVFAGLS